MDDPTMELFSEIVRCGALERVHYGLDYFDASINLSLIHICYFHMRLFFMDSYRQR